MKTTPLPSVEKEVEKTMQKLGGIDRNVVKPLYGKIKL